MIELSTEERIELIELLGRYGRMIDDRNWEALETIFTPDARFDLSPIGRPLLTGLDEIREYMANRAAHPVAHHITNPHIDRLGDDDLWLSCMLVAVQADGSVASGRYSDQVVRHDGGLRIRYRQFRWLLAPGTSQP